MLVCQYHLSLWIFVLLICYLQLWDTASSDLLPVSPPTPSLTQASSVGNTVLGTVVLVCRAPEGPGGTLFRLHRVKKLVDTMTFPSERQEAQFTVRVREDSARELLYCCLYQNSQGKYSPYSHYLTLKQQGVASPRAPPPPPSPPLLPPLLSVDPTGGQVKHGQTLSFHCSPPPPHSQQSPKPEAFLLLKTAKATGHAMGSFMVHPQASLVSQSTAQTGAFHLGPVRGGEGGSYTCLYQVIVPRRGPANSTASHPVLVTVTGLTGVDWPLVLSCLSVVVLFFIVLVGVGVVVQRKVKVIAEEKRKREGALLWAELNSRDHVLDLTLKHFSITSQEWGNDDRAAETAETAFSRSPPWRTLSTFSNTPSS
ncbi:uncharacterized protein LOC115178312 isoform X4 [Salmo trutta]|uniref:uncharacterized protein LOC115178312 isoform X4 n=1 Tax=Salmo trutta TaxID=8032 RepID=UPI001130740F|nr:protein HIDE1 isoform X4 [Salmo trutta]